MTTTTTTAHGPVPASAVISRDPVAGLAPLDDADIGYGDVGPEYEHDRDEVRGGSVQDELARLRRIVEVEHDRRFQRIESDLRWVIMLTTAQLVAIIGGAIATFTLS